MRNPFEDQSFERIDIDIFHEQAVATLSKARIKEGRFSDIYKPEIIEHDKKVVTDSEARHERDSTEEQRELKKIAEIFEAVIFSNGDSSEWFGPRANMAVASKYDDFENGVDEIVEFSPVGDEPVSHLGLGIDVTFNIDSTKKLDRIKAQIDKGRLTEVKYYESPIDGTHDRLKDIPEVIVGAERKMVLELGALSRGRKMSGLANHKIQIMMLVQVKDQLETFAMYAESVGKGWIAEVLRERLAIIDGILKDKKELFDKVKHELADDSVHFNITSYLRRLRQKIIEGQVLAA